MFNRQALWVPSALAVLSLPYDQHLQARYKRQ